MKRFYTLLFLLLLMACRGENLPDGILPRKVMVPLMVDIHLAEAVNNQRYSFNLARDSVAEDLYIYLCRKYKVEHDVIEKSLLYYGKNPKKFVPIYNEVLDVLNEMEIKEKGDTTATSVTGADTLKRVIE